MKNYRIIKLKDSYGDFIYRIEEKFSFLFFTWWEGRETHYEGYKRWSFNELDEAKGAVKMLEYNRKKRVVG